MFLGVHITNKLSWSKHTKRVVKRARQSLFPLGRLKIFVMGPQIPQKVLQLHHREQPGWLHHCLVWQLLGVEDSASAQYITGAKLPDIQDLFTRRCQRKALKIAKDSSHPNNELFSLLPDGKWYWSTKSRSKMLLDSFYPQAIRLLNNESNDYPDYLLLLFVYYYAQSLYLYLHVHITSITSTNLYQCGTGTPCI